MLRNYIKMAFRNLTKNKTFSLVNILGVLFVMDELSFANFHDDADDVYRVVQHITEPSGDARQMAMIAPSGTIINSPNHVKKLLQNRTSKSYEE